MRDLRVTTPYTHGDSVRKLQLALNQRAAPRGMQGTAVDGEYGPDTDGLAKQIAWLLGLYTKHLGSSDPLKVYAQQRIIDPNKRNATQKKREKQRFKAFEGDTIHRVLEWCSAQVGTTESPANSNRGPLVSRWERDFGMDAQPWCGAFVGYPLRHVAGLPIPNGVVYTPNIIGYARAGSGGFLEWHSWDGRKPGDLVLFKWSGVSRDACDHVGILDADGRHTIEGNTSSGDSGSQNNGGGVYRRDRQGANVVGCARPRYR